MKSTVEKRTSVGKQKAVKFQSTLISGSYLTGVLKTETSVELEGEVNGNVISKQIIVIGKSCVYSGELNARILEIKGKVEGNLVGEELVILRPTAIVKGFISAPKLEVDTGACFDGKIKMS